MALSGRRSPVLGDHALQSSRVFLEHLVALLEGLGMEESANRRA
jgi:hypothetical protein